MQKSMKILFNCMHLRWRKCYEISHCKLFPFFPKTMPFPLECYWTIIRNMVGMWEWHCSGNVHEIKWQMLHVCPMLANVLDVSPKS